MWHDVEENAFVVDSIIDSEDTDLTDLDTLDSNDDVDFGYHGPAGVNYTLTATG